MPAPLDWAEVESSPWFNDLTPSEKSATHLEWRDTVLSEQEDLDDDTKVKLLALSESRAKTLAGQPQDPEPLKTFYAEREKRNAEVSQGYEAFTRGEIQDDPEFAALDETFKGRRDAALVRGGLYINPALVLDKDKYEAAVKASDAPMSEKALALSQFQGRNEQASETLANTLSYTDEDFRKFASEGYNQGKTNSQVVSDWKAKQKLPDGIFGSILGAGRQAKLGFSGGLSGLERAVGGIGMALGVGGEQYAAESGQEAASFAARREMAGGAPIIGEVAEGATSLIPTLAVGAVGAALSPTPAALAAAPVALAAGAAARATLSRALTSLSAGAVTGGLQSAGSTVADAFEMYKMRGDTDADAIGNARVDGAVSGIITGAVTGLFGALGSKLGAGGGIETLFRRKASETLGQLGEKEVKNAFVTAAKSVLGNASEEAIEEGTDQLLQGLYEAATRSPDKDFRSILEETAHAAKIGGILGGGFQAVKEGLSFKSMVETAKTDPNLGDPTLNAAVAQGLVDEKQFERDANEALEATVNANLGLSQEKRAALIAKRAADQLRTIGTAPLTTAVVDSVASDAENRVKLNADAIRAEVVDTLSRPTLPSVQQMVQGAGQALRGLPDRATLAANAAAQLQAVASNTATPEQVASLTEQGLARVVNGQPVITDAGLAMLPPDQQPPLSEAERVAEIKAAPVSGQREVDLFGEPIPAEGQTTSSLDQLETIELPVKDITLSRDVPQFKSDADARGVVEPLAGKYQRLGTGPILVWERLDGRKEVISGRHRFDLAKRTGEKTIPAQVVREADGFNQQLAMTADAELNIRDGQGKVKDYANYFRNAEIDEGEADARGLRARAAGRAGWVIGTQASKEVADLHANGKLTDAAAEAIARTAPNNEALQRVGARSVLDGQPIDVSVNLMQVMQAELGIAGTPEQLDLFGSDDSTMEAMRVQAKRAAMIQRDLREQVAAVKGASKRPEKAKAMGVDVKDPEAVRRKVYELELELDRWGSWPLHEDLRAQVRGQQSVSSATAEVEPTPDLLLATDEEAVPVEEKAPTPAAEAELFPIETSTRPEVRGETKVAQVPQEDLLGGLAEAKVKGEAERAQTKMELGDLLQAINAMPDNSTSRVVPGAAIPVTDKKSGYVSSPNWIRKPGFKARAQSVFNKFFPQVAIVEYAPGQSFNGSVVLSFKPTDGYGYRIFLHELGHALANINPKLFTAADVRAELGVIAEDSFYINTVLEGKGSEYTLSPGEVIAEFNAARFALPELNTRFPVLAAALDSAVEQTPSLNKLSQSEADTLSAKVASARTVAINDIGGRSGSAFDRQYARIVQAADSTDIDFIRTVMEEVKTPFTDPSTGEQYPWTRAGFTRRIESQIAEGSIDAELIVRLNQSKAEKPKPTTPKDELVSEQRDEPPAAEPGAATAGEPAAVAEEESTPVQDRPVEEVPAAPAAEPAAADQGGAAVAATEEVAPPAAAKPTQAMDSAKAERKAQYDAKRAELAEKAKRLSKELGTAADVLNRVIVTKGSIPFFDPEVFKALSDVATGASKLGIVRFEEFAALIKYQFPQFWDSIKEILSAVWNAATRADRTLRETPSNAEVDRIIADLDEFDDMDAGAEVAPADTTTTEEVAAAEGKVEPVDTGKTISEDTAAKLPFKYPPFSPGDGEPNDDDLRQNVGFGKLRSTPIRQVMGMDKHYLFVKIFDDTDRDIAVVASDEEGKERLDQIRKLVVRTEAYREYQEDLKLTPEQIAAENAEVADQFEETAESLRAQGFEVAVAPNGAIRIKLPKLDSKIKSDYEKLLRSNNIRWENANAQTKQGAYVSGLSRDIIGLGSDIDDYLAGRPVAYQRAAKQTNVRRVADRLRAELDQADDESDLDAKEIGRFVSQGTRKKLYGGVLYGDLPMEVHNEQVYDAALIGKAHKDKKPMFLLASQPGSGKTYIIGAAIERMRQNHLESQRKDKIPEADRKPLRVIYVTLNEELKDQFKKNLSDYDIGEIEYLSYAALDNKEGKTPPSESDVIIFDEAHSIRYSVSGDASNRAIKAGEWMKKSKFTLLASATPYEDLEQMRFLWAAGAYKPFARDDLRGDTDDGWFGFAEVLGAEVMLTQEKPNSVKFPEDETVLAEMRFTAREYLRKRGMFSQRKTRIPGERIVSNFTAVKAEEQWVKAFDATVVALAKMKNANKGLKAFVINLQKRILEASKREAAIKIAREDVAAGKRVVIFIETRSGRDRDLPQIVEDYRAWKEGGGKFEDKPDSVPGVDGIDKFFEEMINEGVDRITFPKAQDYYTEALGDLNVVFYTGEESAGQGKSSLAKWESGEASVMVATMGKGGTGLSLHDTKGLDNGGAERSQIILNLPWLASQIEQVAGRTARYGMKSNALIHWLFTPDIEFDFKLAQKVGNRMASMNSLVQGEITPSAERVVNYRMDQVEDIDKNLEELVPTSNALTPEQNAAVAELNTSEMSIVYTEEDNAYLKMVEEGGVKQGKLVDWESKAAKPKSPNLGRKVQMRMLLANAGVPNDAPLVAWDEDGKVIPPSLRGQAEPADIRQSAAPSLSPVYGLVKRTLTMKDKLQVKEALRILRKAIPQIDSLVTVDSRENLLKRDDLTEAEKAAIRGPNFAQGIYSNGRVFVAFNNVVRTDKHASEAAAIAGTIVHELMHKGAAIMRLSPDLAPVYASWKSMLDAHVNDGDLTVLVNSGYPGYAEWRSNSAIREKAQEEVFVKRIEALFHKGDLLTDAEKTLMQRFLSFIRSLVNRLLGKEMSMEDEVVQRWGRFFVVATANRHISLDGSGGLMTSSMGRSPQAIRHAELEAKHNAGTITPEETAEAQALVDAAAKAAGYNVGPVFHRTKADFTVFDLSKSSSGAVWGPAIYASVGDGSWNPASLKNSKVIKGYVGGKVIDLTQPSASDLQTISELIGRELDTIPLVTLERRYGSVAEGLKAAGFSAAIHKGPGSTGKHIAVFDPNQIKSAEPFTGISLDQRFDITSPDIRQSMAPGESPRDGADEPRPASLFSTYITPVEAAAVEAAAARMDAAKAGGDDPLAKFARQQVLGQAGVGMVYKQQQLGPQQEFAMNYIGFTENASGLPEVNAAATKKAKSIALDLLNPNSFFAMRYQEEAGNYDAAAAVLQLELTRYAIAMLAKGDASLLSTVRRNWNNIIMGKYLTMASAGRLLQARSHYTGIVATTLDEMTAAQNKAALKLLKEQKAKDPIRTLQDLENAVANALPDYSALWDALGKGKGIPAPNGNPDLNWLDKAMSALDSHRKNALNKIMSGLARSARIIDALSKMKDDDIRRSMPDWMAEAEGEELPTDRAELEALLAKVQDGIANAIDEFTSGADEGTPLPPEIKKVLDDNAPKVKRKPVAAKPPMDKDAPGVIPPEKQKEINDAIAEVDSLEQEGDTKSTEAAIAKLTQLLADLAKVPSPTVPSDSIIAKIRRIVAEHIRNGENVAYSDFYDSMTEDFGGLAEEVGETIREDIQEQLIQATWQTFDQAANKTAQDMLAQMKSIKDITYGKPDQARQVKKEVRAAIVNRDGLTEIPLKKRLTDALVALKVEKDVATELAEEAYGQSVRYAAKRLALRTAKITESMAAGGNKRMLAAMAKASPDMVSDPTWQHNAVRSVFEASGFSFEEAEIAATNAASRFDDIFTNSGIRFERDAKKRMDDAVVRLLDKYAALQSDTPSLKKAAALRKRNIEDLFRQQVRVPISFGDIDGAAGFETLARAMGATRQQAMILFHEAETETRYNQQRGTDRLIQTKLIEFIKLKTSAELNEPGLRDTMVEAFLKSNGFTPEQIREVKPNILNNLEKYLGEARSAAITRILKQNAAYKKALEAKDTSFMTEAEKQLKKTLERIRLGIADTTSSVAEVLAGSLEEPVKFLKTDMVTLAQLDSRITAAQNDGRTHDAAIAIKELYELLARRRQSTGFLERLGIAYNNSALSGIATLGINLYGPVGSMMTRVSIDLLRAVKNKDWDAISLVFNSLADTFSYAYAEGSLALRGDAYTNAMQRVILKVNNLRQGAIKATEVLKDKGAKPWDRVKALGVVVQSYTDITRRILSTADQTWFSTMQGYFYKLQASKALINNKMPLPMVQKAVFDITEKTALKIKNDKAMIDTYASRVEALRGKPEEEFRAGINAIVRDTSYLDDDSVSLADEVREYRTTMDNELRSIIRAAALPYKKRPDLAVDKVLKELKLQKLAVDLRQRDLVVKDIDDLLTGRFGEAEAKRIKKFAEKESEYEIGNHKGEAGSQLDIFNQFSLLIQNAGYSVIQKNPILGRMLLGYFGVPVNLLNRSLWYTPYGLLRYAAAKRMEGIGLPNGEFYRQSMETAEQMKQRFSEAILGTSVFAFALALQALGDDDEEELFNVTLAGPTNKTEYDAWVKNGHRKGAIEMNLDGKVYSVNWARGLFEPWKPAFVAMGAYDDMKLNRKLGDKENEVAVINYLGAAMSGWSQQASFFGAKTTIGSTFSANPDTNMLGTLAYKASPLIPFSGLLNSISKFYTGPNTYRGREGAIWANIPVASMFATNRAVNALGDPVGVTGNAIEVANDRAWYAGMPLNVGGNLTGNDAKIYEFILERGTGPGIPQRSAIETKNGFITDAEFLDYVSYRGRIVKTKMLRDLPKLRAMNDESLSKAIGDISSDATSEAKKRFRYK